MLIVHPEDRERVRNWLIATLNPGGPATVSSEHRILRPDGSVRWVLVKGGVFFTSKGAEREPVFSVGFAIDITERKVAERTLEASEQRYRTLIDNANDIVATLDLEGRFTSVNPIVGRILGYTSQEMIGAPLRRFVPTEFHPTHGMRCAASSEASHSRNTSWRCSRRIPASA